MGTELKKHFPMIRDRKEILAEINGKQRLRRIFQSWKKERQEEFLDFCTGVRGIKFLYDSFFKEIFNPELARERLEEFLSLLLDCSVKILEVLPTDSTRLGEESSLLIMDIVVQLSGGAIVNLEVQKVGYKFPGERSACYSSDLLLRQYKRAKSRKNKRFSYKDIKDVYTIVLFESSPERFRRFPDTYRHYFRQTSDTGLEMELLQKYLFIPLDIFREKLHNKDKKMELGKLEAWLAFLCEDDPGTVLWLIDAYPEFKPLYEDAYELCRNIEEVMEMFSKELAILDRNTVQLMIDEMHEKIELQSSWLKEKDLRLAEQNSQLMEQGSKLAEQNSQLMEQGLKLAEQSSQLMEQGSKLAEQSSQLVEQGSKIAELDSQLAGQKATIDRQAKQMNTMICQAYLKLRDENAVADLLEISVDQVQKAIQSTSA